MRRADWIRRLDHPTRESGCGPKGGARILVVRTKLRTGFLLGAAVLLMDVAVSLAACSSRQPPPAASEAQDAGSPRSDGAADASALDDANAADAEADAEADAAADGPANDCLGDTLTPVDGGDASIVCPSSGACSAACGRIVDRYKAGVAQAAVDCILALPSCTSSADVAPCVDSALTRACLDPTSPGYCAPLVTPCDSDAGQVGSMITEHRCEWFANGLADAGRTALATCIHDKITAGTCAAEVGACADEIRQ